MKKNESGYPREAKPKAPTSPGATDGRPKRNCTGELMDGGADAGSPMGAARDTRENAPRQIGGAGCNMAEGACGGGGLLDGEKLAYLYAPSQKFCMLYSASDALKHGTLFEQLYKPKGVYGNE